MGFLKNLFGTKADLTEEEERQRVATRQFETLRDSGVRAMQMGELKLAIPYFEKALELRPDDRQTQAYMAEAQLKARNYAAALPYLERLAPEEADGIELRLLLANAHGRTGDFAAMQATVEPLMDAHASDARVPFLAAEAAHGLAYNSKAIDLLTQTLQAHPDYVVARLLRARILGEMGQWHEAVADTSRLAASETADEESLLLHGEALTATAAYEGAESVYQRVLEGNPFCREAFIALEQLFETTTQWDKALALCDEAVAAMPDFAEIYKLRSGVKHHLNDEAGATDDLKRSLELKPELAENSDGEFSNLENRMADNYRRLNPYQF